MSCLPTWMFGVFVLFATGQSMLPARVADVAPAQDELQIEDMAGRKVVFRQYPGKVLIYPPIQTAFATIDGSVERLAAIPDYLRFQAQASLLSHIYPGLERIPSSGRNHVPEPERLLLALPDAVFVWKSSADALLKTGVRGVVQVDSTRKDAKRDIWRLLGAVTGRMDRAEKLLLLAEDFKARLRGDLARINERPTSLLLALDRGDNRWAVASRSHYLNDTFQFAGGTNVGAGLGFSLNAGLEEIIRYDPEVILLPSPDGIRTSTPQTLYETPAWQPLRAIRNRRVYIMPRHFTNNLAVDELLLMTWLAEILHPDSMPQMIRVTFREIYGMVYAYELTDDEIDEALFMDQNCQSYGCARFRRTQ